MFIRAVVVSRAAFLLAKGEGRSIRILGGGSMGGGGGLGRSFESFFLHKGGVGANQFYDFSNF